MPDQQFPIGRRIDLPGHFAAPVVLESVRALGDGFECRVRLSDGTPDEAILSCDEAATIFGQQAEAPTSIKPVDAESLRLIVESSRIRLAYTHDRHFAVSLSGIRTLPHQIEAVYLRMLPQPRLRFLLADDPGAGKTIMAGLLIKEMKLREAIDRVLILCPAPLTIQWQDELLRWFGESFDIIFSAVDQQQLVNPWHRTSQVIASLDYAKQDDVRERVLSERWDLVIIDEAHKCSAYTKSSSGRGDEIEKTKRYQIAEKLAANTDHLLLLTATPHHGDDDRFCPLHPPHRLRPVPGAAPRRKQGDRDSPRHPQTRPGLPVGAPAAGAWVFCVGPFRQFRNDGSDGVHRKYVERVRHADDLRQSVLSSADLLPFADHRAVEFPNTSRIGDFFVQFDSSGIEPTFQRLEKVRKQASSIAVVRKINTVEQMATVSAVGKNWLGEFSLSEPLHQFIGGGKSLVMLSIGCRDVLGLYGIAVDQQPTPAQYLAIRGQFIVPDVSSKSVGRASHDAFVQAIDRHVVGLDHAEAAGVVLNKLNISDQQFGIVVVSGEDALLALDDA
jgi:SNF2-related domain